MDEILSRQLVAMGYGLFNSLGVSAIGIVLGLAIGVLFGAIRYAHIPVAHQIVGIYINFFRCTPLLVQIFMLYFALPEIGIRLSPFATSWLALGLWGGAYQAEVFRAGFTGVSKHDVLAARALGMPRLQTFLDITLPIGLRSTIQAATTTAITQFRSSSFMIVVGYMELTYVANRIVSETFEVFEIFGIAAVMYLAVCLLISSLSRALERALHVPGMGVAK
ncbi:conserved membrane hypothetical protein [Agrobacterium fabacearum S56]|uniref:amino acid ABC transporter permease n=1 Tax=Agrobacterium tumefaciens TaxID=358 RepID=UPI0009CC0227|nr:amino acid ABC transporter permease [Agrobacterium tumefaciens]CUX07054.1 conserved membrane hypothetical protein [Agrobacterium fabacearum S56]